MEIVMTSQPQPPEKGRLIGSARCEDTSVLRVTLRAISPGLALPEPTVTHRRDMSPLCLFTAVASECGEIYNSADFP